MIITITFDSILWVEIESLSKKFDDKSTFQELEKNVLRILKNKYPKQTKNISCIKFIQFGSKRYLTGKIIDRLINYEIIYPAYFKTRGRWEKCTNSYEVKAKRI